MLVGNECSEEPVHDSHLLTALHPYQPFFSSSFFFSFPFYTLFSILKTFSLILLKHYIFSVSHLLALPSVFQAHYTFYSIHNIYQNL